MSTNVNYIADDKSALTHCVLLTPCGVGDRDQRCMSISGNGFLLDGKKTIAWNNADLPSIPGC